MSRKGAVRPGIDQESNTVIAGFREEHNVNGLVASDIRYMKETSLNGLTVMVKNVTTQKPVAARLPKLRRELNQVYRNTAGNNAGQLLSFITPQVTLLAGGTIEAPIQD